MKQIFLLDNFDSFTYNLVDQFRSIGYQVSVYRNSVNPEIIMEKMSACNCEGKPILVLSPGPGNPSEAGCMLELIGMAKGKFPILGICLGHQAICQYYGGTIGAAKEIVHGKTSYIQHSGKEYADFRHVRRTRQSDAGSQIPFSGSHICSIISGSNRRI